MLVLMRQCDLVQLVGSLEDEGSGRRRQGCLKQGQVIINIKETAELLLLLLDNVDDFKVAVRDRSLTMVRAH